jgi:hypothetical protein
LASSAEGERVEHPEQRHPRLPSLVLEDTVRSNKKKSKLRDEPHTLEIPRSPQNESQQSGGFGNHHAQQPYDSPSPARLKFASLKSSTLHSPTYIPPDDDDDNDSDDNDNEEEDRYLDEDSAPNRLQTQLSSIRVSLLSQEDENKHSALLQTQDDFSDSETASVYAFDTAPEMSPTQDWETAPQERTTQTAMAQERLETQALWDITEEINSNLLDEFALPEPEGGWEAVEARYEDDVQVISSDEHEDMVESNTSATAIARQGKGKDKPTPSLQSPQADQVELEIDATNESNSESETPSQISSLSSWLPYLSRLHPPSTLPLDTELQPLAIAAIKATGFDFQLATKVVTELIRSIAEQEPDEEAEPEDLLPVDVPGCWLQEEDELLLGDDKSEWERLERKHGRRRLKERFEYLAAYERGSNS